MTTDIKIVVFTDDLRSVLDGPGRSAQECVKMLIIVQGRKGVNKVV